MLSGQAERVNQDRCRQAGGASPAYVVVDRVADVPRPGGVDPQPCQGMKEDGGVGLGQTDLVTIDHELKKAVKACPGKGLSNRAIRVGDDRDSNPSLPKLGDCFEGATDGGRPQSVSVAGQLRPGLRVGQAEIGEKLALPPDPGRLLAPQAKAGVGVHRAVMRLERGPRIDGNAQQSGQLPRVLENEGATRIEENDLRFFHSSHVSRLTSTSLTPALRVIRSLSREYRD
jgi:hypothetical protein